MAVGYCCDQIELSAAERVGATRTDHDGLWMKRQPGWWKSSIQVFTGDVQDVM